VFEKAFSGTKKVREGSTTVKRRRAQQGERMTRQKKNETKKKPLPVTQLHNLSLCAISFFKFFLSLFFYPRPNLM